jgi:hypothetical protein
VEKEIITVFCFVDELLKAIDINTDKQAQMSLSEIVTTALVAVKYFGTNYARALNFLKEHRYFKRILSRSRFSRRLNKIPDYLWRILLQAFRQASPASEFVIDSFPIPVCKNVRISRSKLYSGKEYHGFNASKKEYFYGLKVHVLTDIEGIPVEFYIEPAAFHDNRIFKKFTLNIGKNSIIYADAAYNNYAFEKFLQKERSIFLAVKRKSNAKNAPVQIVSYNGKKRKIIETTFSIMLQNTLRKIHAITPRTLELKLSLIIITHALFS